MFAAGADNDNANSIYIIFSIIFTIKGTKIHVPVITLSAKDNQKLSKLLSKEFKRSVYWNEHRTKSENKNTANEHRYFLESNFVGVIYFLLFLLVYSSEDNNVKRLKTQKELLIITALSLMRKAFMTNPLILI